MMVVRFFSGKWVAWDPSCSIVDPEIRTIWEALECYTEYSMNPHTPTFKAQVALELLKEEKTLTQIAAEHGIHPGQLDRSKRQVLDNFPHLSKRA